MKHAPDWTIAGDVVRMQTTVDENKGNLYRVKIRCDQCGWTHWVDVTEEQYKEAKEAMDNHATFDCGLFWKDVATKFYPN